MEVPQNTRSRTTICLGNTVLGYISEKRKTLNQRATCTPVYTAALFTTAKIWKQPYCPSTGEWTKKMRYTCTMENISSAQPLGRVGLCATPRIAARQASLSITNSRRSLRLNVHRVSDAIQPSHPLLFPSPPAPNPSQHQSLFQ